MVLPPSVGVGGIILVVEGHTGADNVKDCHTVMTEGSFQQFFNLFGVTGEGTSYKCGIGCQCFQANIHGHILINALVLQV